jgi:hypothetical protein
MGSKHGANCGRHVILVGPAYTWSRLLLAKSPTLCSVHEAVFCNDVQILTRSDGT